MLVTETSRWYHHTAHVVDCRTALSHKKLDDEIVIGDKWHDNIQIFSRSVIDIRKIWRMDANFKPAPVVWSTEGPVSTEGVPSLSLVHSKSSSWAWVYSQKFSSKSHSTSNPDLEKKTKSLLKVYFIAPLKMYTILNPVSFYSMHTVHVCPISKIAVIFTKILLSVVIFIFPKENNNTLFITRKPYSLIEASNIFK